MRQRLFGIRDYVYERVNKVVYLSAHISNLSYVPQEHSTYIYNGAPDVEYEFKEKLSDRIEFVCVASTEGWKGQEIIIEALSKLDEEHRRQLHVTFIGGGSELENLKQQSRILDVAGLVTFLGRRNDVAELLRDKDVFILPSKKEAMPMSAIEALRAGCYLMMTDTGGCAEVAADGCGMMITRDPDELKTAIAQVIDNDVVSLSQKRHCRERFLNVFSLRCMAESYERVLTGL